MNTAVVWLSAWCAFTAAGACLSCHRWLRAYDDITQQAVPLNGSPCFRSRGLPIEAPGGKRREELFHLYLQIARGQSVWLEFHRAYAFRYLGLATASIAAQATLFGAVGKGLEPVILSYSQLGWVLPVGVLAFASAEAISSGVSCCDRAYRRWLEDITIMAKLEALLGLDGTRPARREHRVFPDDCHLLPTRWLADRAEHKSGRAFVEDKMSAGSNALVRNTLRLFGTLQSLVGGACAGWITAICLFYLYLWLS